MARRKPDTFPWVTCIHSAWEAREHMAWHGDEGDIGDIFCDCERCAALPERPEWMRNAQATLSVHTFCSLLCSHVPAHTPQRFSETVERVIAAKPGDPSSWEMHGAGRHAIGDYVGAARSYSRAAQMYLGEDDTRFRDNCLAKAKDCRRAAKRVQERQAAREKERMAPIMAEREAAADAAMKELLAEEEAAPAKAKKKKNKGRKK